MSLRLKSKGKVVLVDLVRSVSLRIPRGSLVITDKTELDETLLTRVRKMDEVFLLSANPKLVILAWEAKKSGAKVLVHRELKDKLSFLANGWID